MNSLVKEFQNFFFRLNIPLDNKFLIGVSGGVDSMATLALSLETKLNIQVAHVNYQLRGEESERESKIVADYCKKKSVKFHSKSVIISAKENTQIEARNIRYSFFQKILFDNNLDFIITAHQSNDNHETFLLNSIRGSGIRGLKGIPEKRGNIIRPVLQFNKKQLLDYALKVNVPYHTDSSNLEINYDRNFLRTEILKPLSKRFSSFENGMTNSIDNLKKDYLLLAELVDKMILPCIEKKAENYFIYPTKNIPDHCWCHFFKKFGFNFKQISIWLNKEVQTGKFIESSSFKLMRDREMWILSPNNTDHEIEVKSDLQLNENIDYPIRLKSSSEYSKFPLSKNINVGLFEIKNLTFPLQLRKWKNGDKMQPLGTNGRKKISDILIDKKIAAFEKDNIYVLLSNNEIIWLVGYCISEKFKVKEDNQLLLKVIFSP